MLYLTGCILGCCILLEYSICIVLMGMLYLTGCILGCCIVLEYSICIVLMGMLYLTGRILRCCIVLEYGIGLFTWSNIKYSCIKTRQSTTFCLLCSNWASNSCKASSTFVLYLLAKKRTWSQHSLHKNWNLTWSYLLYTIIKIFLDTSWLYLWKTSLSIRNFFFSCVSAPWSHQKLCTFLQWVSLQS